MTVAALPTTISRVDANIQHLSQLAAWLFPPAVGGDERDASTSPSPIRSLNLHGNLVSRMDPSILQRMAFLTSLDLSSNEILEIEGVAGLRLLRILNLANNRISRIQGLETLTGLRKLVLAHNNIDSLVGIVHLHGPGYALEVLDVRGNAIAASPELYYLSGLVNLRHLLLEGNPVSDDASTQGIVWSLSRSLQSLDRVDRNGAPVQVAIDMSFLLPDTSIPLPAPPTSAPPAPAVAAPAPVCLPRQPVATDPAPLPHQFPSPAKPQQLQQPPPLPDPALVQLHTMMADLVRAMSSQSKAAGLESELSAVKQQLAKLERAAAKAQTARRPAPPPPPPPPAPEPVADAASRAATQQTLAALELEARRMQQVEHDRAREMRGIAEQLQAERARSAAVAKELEAARSRVAVLERECTAAKDGLSRESATRVDLERRLRVAESEGKRALAKAVRDKEAAREKLAEAKEQLASLKNIVRDVSVDVQALRDQIREQERKHQAQLQDAQRRHDAELASVRSTLAQQHEANTRDLHRQVDEAKTARAALECDLVRATAEQAAHVKDAQAEIARVHERNAALQRQLDESLAQAADLRAQLDTQTREKQDLGRVVHAQQAKIAGLAQSVTDLEQLYEHKTKKLADKLRAAHAAAEAARNHAKQTALQCTNRVHAGDRAVAELEGVRRELEQVRGEAKAASEERERVRAELAAAQQAVRIKDKQVEDQAESLRALKANLAAKVAEFNEVKRAAEGAREMQFELQHREREVQQLEDLASQYREERNEARDQAAALHAKLEERNESLALIEAEAAKLRATFAAKLERAEGDVRDKLAARDLAVDELKRLLQQTQARLTATEQDRDARAVELTQVQRRAAELDDQLRAATHAKQVEVQRVTEQYRALANKWRAMCQLFGMANGAVGTAAPFPTQQAPSRETEPAAARQVPGSPVARNPPQATIGDLSFDVGQLDLNTFMLP
ncbi:hypothetical protein H9P43_009883 [Blastocladiella emersonii ATCC 22665]|nr:hypothetical protein H9P43_009883 [Blastocladiella emersonii ATCC 22665]